MKVVILCGGKGIRAFPFTNYLPKPMLPLGGSPIIVQVIKSFIKQGFTEFVLAAGYLKSVLDDYFEGKNLGARVDIVDTGEDTNTGGRVYACRHLLDNSFIVTYSDGLCDVPLKKLVDFHNSHDGLATNVAVLMSSQYGILSLDGSGKILEFREKPLIKDHWINAGFIVFDKRVFDYWQGEDLEREVMPNLIKKGMAYSYRHSGFFKSMDSYKDQVEFEELLSGGVLPWDVKEMSGEFL